MSSKANWSGIYFGQRSVIARLLFDRSVVILHLFAMQLCKSRAASTQCVLRRRGDADNSIDYDHSRSGNADGSMV